MQIKFAIILIILGIFGLLVAPVHSLFFIFQIAISIAFIGSGIVLLLANAIYPKFPKRQRPKF
jgi:hypothetical protein